MPHEDGHSGNRKAMAAGFLATQKLRSGARQRADRESAG